MEIGKLRKFITTRERTILQMLKKEKCKHKTGFIIDTHLHSKRINVDEATDKFVEDYIMKGAYFLNRPLYYLHTTVKGSVLTMDISIYCKYKSDAKKKAQNFQQNIMFDLEKKQEVEL